MIDQYYNTTYEIVDDLEYVDLIEGFIPDEAADLARDEYEEALELLGPISLSIILEERIDNPQIEQLKENPSITDRWLYQTMNLSRKYPYLDDESLKSVVYLNGISIDWEMKEYLNNNLDFTKYWNREKLDAYLKLNPNVNADALESISEIAFLYMNIDDENRKKLIAKINTSTFKYNSVLQKINILQLAGLPVTVDSIQLFTS